MIYKSYSPSDDKIHIISNSGSWAVKRENASKASAVTDTKEEAIRFAKYLSHNKGGRTIIVHGKDGRIDQWRKSI